MGSVVALFWLAEAWRKGRVREVVRVFAPFTIVLLVSFVLYGFYPLEWVTVEVDQWWNASLWPMSIPIGLTLAVAAFIDARSSSPWRPRHCCRRMCCFTLTLGRWRRWQGTASRW
jgi:hypothetical protein